MLSESTDDFNRFQPGKINYWTWKFKLFINVNHRILFSNSFTVLTLQVETGIPDHTGNLRP